MKGFFKEFKEFISRGNAVQMAVGVVIGGAFTAIVNAVVESLINPLLGIITGGTDFSSLSFSVGEAEFTYGALISAVINFILIALVLFLIVKAMNKMARKKEDAAPTTKKCPYCLSEIAIEATRCPHCTSVLDEAEEK